MRDLLTARRGGMSVLELLTIMVVAVALSILTLVGLPALAELGKEAKETRLEAPAGLSPDGWSRTGAPQGGRQPAD